MSASPPSVPKIERLPGIVPEGVPPTIDWKRYYLTNYSNTIPVKLHGTNMIVPGIVPESQDAAPKTDAELDREFEAIKARLKPVK